VRFVVMGNLFNAELPIHRTFDLKGSTVNRLTPPEKPTSATTTYKDLDLDFVFTLPEEWCHKFKDQVRPAFCFFHVNEQGHVGEPMLSSVCARPLSVC
jgi:hypothetical protein